MFFPVLYCGILTYLSFKRWLSVEYPDSTWAGPKSGGSGDIWSPKNWLPFRYFSEVPRRTLLEKVRSHMGFVVGEVLSDERVNKEGLNFLDRMFRHPQTHEAGQHLLINVLKDDRFME